MAFWSTLSAILGIGSAAYSVYAASQASSRADRDAEEAKALNARVTGVRQAQLAARADYRSRLLKATHGLKEWERAASTSLGQAALEQSSELDREQIYSEREMQALAGIQGLRDVHQEIIQAAKVAEEEIGTQTGRIRNQIETQHSILEARGVVAQLQIAETIRETELRKQGTLDEAQAGMAEIAAVIAAGGGSGNLGVDAKTIAIARGAHDRMQLLSNASESRRAQIEAAMEGDKQQFELAIAHAGDDVGAMRRAVRTDLIGRVVRGGLMKTKIAENYGVDGSADATRAAMVAKMMSELGVKDDSAHALAGGRFSKADQAMLLDLARVRLKEEIQGQKITLEDALAFAQNDLNRKFGLAELEIGETFDRQLIELGVEQDNLAVDRNREAINIRARAQMFESAATTGLRLSRMSWDQAKDDFRSTRNSLEAWFS